MQSPTQRVRIGLAFFALLSLACFCTSPFTGSPVTDILTSAGPSMTVSPGRGPSGTSVTITISGAQPNAPVTLDLDPGTTTGTTDANGNFSFTTTFSGPVGQVSNITATIGTGGNDQTASGTFEITGDQATATPAPTPTPQTAGPTLTVSPGSGPSGTTATITISGARPNAPVTLELDPGTVTGTTDANGDFSTRQTFYGPVGKVSNIRATIGTGADDQSASGTFEITGELEQAFNTLMQVISDLGGHERFIAMLEELALQVLSGSVVVEGPAPWVTVVGEIGPDGSFVASGRGTVAGFQDIAVSLEGSVSMNHLEAEYSMGVEGGLPGGQAITYSVSGIPIEPAAGSPLALAQAFFQAFNAAQAGSNSEAMLSMLHPAVLELYGDAACTDYLAGIVDPSVAIEPLSAVETGSWDWERDGVTTAIDNTFTVQAELTAGDETSEAELHLAVRPDGSLGWFTDCGDPAP